MGTALPMIIGFLFVRPIPLPASELAHPAAIEELEVEAVTAAGIDPESLGLIQEEDDPRTALLASVEEGSSDSDSESRARFGPSVNHGENGVELSPPRSTASKGARSRSSSKKRRDNAIIGVNVYGKALWMNRDFWLLCSILSLRECLTLRLRGNIELTLFQLAALV
jgi:hypothetical protein